MSDPNNERPLWNILRFALLPALILWAIVITTAVKFFEGAGS